MTDKPLRLLSIISSTQLHFDTHNLTITPYSDLGLAFLYGGQGHDGQCLVSWRKDFPLVSVPLQALIFLDMIFDV